MTQTNIPSELDLNEAARPHMPPIAGVTAAEREKGGHLKLIHNQYRAEMARVAAVLERVAAGDDPPESLRSIVLSSNMAQNLHAVGTICGHQCRVLTMHHDIEQHHMFPALEAAGHDALAQVVAKLRQEHEVIHALLVHLSDAAEALIASPDEVHFTATRAAFDRLNIAIASHFGWEESTLEEAIGHYLDGI